MSKILKALGKYPVVLSLVAMMGICTRSTSLAAGEASPEKPASREVSTSSRPGGTATATPAGQAKQEEQKLTLFRIFQLGGFLMYPLFACSLALVAMVTYFLLVLTPKNIMPPAFLKRVQQIIRDKKIDEARMFCAQNRNLVSHIIRSGLEAVQRGPGGVLEAMNSEGSRRGASLWLRISFISDIAVVAPMIGLLGTVVGMFVAFMRVSTSGMTAGLVNPAYLTSGVAMAVITTIAGLFVAIPATIAYSYFRAVVQRIMVNLEIICSRYSEMIAEAAK